MSKGKEPHGKRPSEALAQRGHHDNHGKGAPMSHSDFQGLDHGGPHDHMKGRDGSADCLSKGE